MLYYTCKEEVTEAHSLKGAVSMLFGFKKLGSLLDMFSREKDKSTSIVGTVCALMFMAAGLLFMGVMVAIVVLSL